MALQEGSPQMISDETTAEQRNVIELTTQMVLEEKCPIIDDFISLDDDENDYTDSKPSSPIEYSSAHDSGKQKMFENTA